MSRKKKNPQHSRQSQVSQLHIETNPQSRIDKSSWFAAIWVISFFIFFYSFTLPNNSPVSRLDLWKQIPFHLLDLVDPPPPEPDAPLPAPSGWIKIPQRFDLILIAGIILCGAWGLGRLLLRPLHLSHDTKSETNSLEQTLFAFAVGLSALSLVTLGCGLMGLLSRSVLGSIIAIAVVAEMAIQFGVRRKQKLDVDTEGSNSGQPFQGSAKQQTRTKPSESKLKALCIVVITPFLLAMFLGSMLPSIDFDVKEYHQQGPKEFYQQGFIALLPHNVYTSFPFLTEMLTLLSMVLRDDWYRGALAGKLVLMCFAPLTALALYIAGQRWFSSTVGWLAALIFLTTPWTYRISIIAYAEGGLTFFLFVTLLATMIGIEKLSEKESPLTQFLLAGFLAGSAMACKYTGILQVVLPMAIASTVAVVILHSDEKGRAKHAAQVLGVFLIGTALAIGPWLSKNFAQTGNPVYPLMYSIFGGADWNENLDQKWRDAHSPDNHRINDLGEKFIDVTAKSDWQSPLLFGLAPLSLLVTGYSRTVRWLWVYVAYLFFAWWIFTHRIDRFWVPLIPVITLLAAAGAAWRNNEFWKIFCGVAIASVVLFNLGFITTGLCGYNHYLIDLKAAQRFTANLTSPEIETLNQLASKDDIKVLSVGDAECFDAQFPIIYNTVFDRSLFQELCSTDISHVPASEQTMRLPHEIHKRLQQEGITHIYVNWQEILRYRTTYGYTDFVTPQRFEWLQENQILSAPLADPLAFRKMTSLSKREQEEIETWGPSLKVMHEGTAAFITSQIFPVAN